jgi:hypothetical protein
MTVEQEPFSGLRGNEWVKEGAEDAETRSGSGRKHRGGRAEIRHDRRMRTPPRPRRLRDTYRFPGFCPRPTVVGIFGDPHARILHGAIPLHVRDLDYPHEGSRRSAGECSGTRRDTRMPYALVRIMSRSQRNTYARNS